MELLKVENGKIEVEEKAITDIKNFEKMKIQVELMEKKLREELLEAMEKYNITNWETDDKSIKAIYKHATTKTIIDSARLKKELPDIAEEYSKTSDVKSSVALTIEV